jgi:hypothetical protein
MAEYFTAMHDSKQVDYLALAVNTEAIISETRLVEVLIAFELFQLTEAERILSRGQVLQSNSSTRSRIPFGSRAKSFGNRGPATVVHVIAVV